MTAARGTVLAACFALAALPSVALADDRPPPLLFGVADDEAEATRWYQRGNALLREKRLEEARDAYSKAWSAHKSVAIATNLAVVENELGRPIEAAEHFWYALHELPANAPAALRATIEQQLGETKKKLGTLVVRCNVAALFTVESRERGLFLCGDEPDFVTPGRQTARVSDDGFEPQNVSVELEAGATREVFVTLARRPKPLAAAAPPPREEPGAGPDPLVVAIGATLSVLSLGGGVAIVVGEGSNGSQHTFENVAVGAFVAGGVLALGTGLYAFWPRASKPKPESGPSVSLAPMPRGVSVRGTF